MTRLAPGLIPTGASAVIASPAAGTRRLASLATRARANVEPEDGEEKRKKRHALLTFGFCGTNYYGLQSHTAEGDVDRPTISDEIRAALLKQGFILPSNFSPMSRTKWTLASRTDKGVHAACAAASCKVETFRSDLEFDGDAIADNLEAEAEEPWTLSAGTLSRINSELPPVVRVFSGSRVRGRFDGKVTGAHEFTQGGRAAANARVLTACVARAARECASSRVYEYLLPLSTLGSCSLPDFDEILRTFEGTHRMHNFASGLRPSSAETFTSAETGESFSSRWTAMPRLPALTLTHPHPHPHPPRSPQPSPITLTLTLTLTPHPH